MAGKDERRRVLTVREAGDLGGLARKRQLGQKGYVELGRKGGRKVASERGSAFFSSIGQKGGASRRAQLGREGYAAMGKKGAAARARDRARSADSATASEGGQAP